MGHGSLVKPNNNIGRAVENNLKPSSNLEDSQLSGKIQRGLLGLFPSSARNQELHNCLRFSRGIREFPTKGETE